MAVVYAGTDLVLERRIAVKRLSAALVGDPDAIRRFEREGRALASVHDPNVVGVFDVGEDQDGPYLVMELVEGRTLRVVLDAEGRLEPHRAVSIAAAMAQGLAAVHRRGITHRDVKPSNVFVMDDDQVKIGDFGIARLAEGSTVTRAGEVLGSAAYIAPEQLTGGNVGPAADLYGLGCVLFEMLAGRPPFEGNHPVSLSYKHVHEEAPRIESIRTDVPPRVAEVVGLLLAKEPEDRPSSAEDARLLLIEAAISREGDDPGGSTTEPLAAAAAAGGAETQRLDPTPTTPLPPPDPTAPLPPPGPTAPLPTPAGSTAQISQPGPSSQRAKRRSSDAETQSTRSRLPGVLGIIAGLVLISLLTWALMPRHSAPPQTSPGQRSPSSSPSTLASPSATVPPSANGSLQTAGSALVSLSDQLLSEGQINKNIASNVQSTVDGVLAQGGGGDSQQLIDDLRHKLDHGRHVRSAEAAQRLNQALDTFAAAVAAAQG
jgi:eukaryotic-like serine/threonine-protein kinase